MNVNRAELYGAFCGDGCLTIAKRKGGSERKIALLTGHLEDESAYYRQVILPTLRKEFGTSGHFKERKDYNAFDVVLGKEVFTFLKNLEFPIGKKKGKLRVPEEIKEDKLLLRAFLRGLFDTDGSLFFDKRPIYEKPYPRIDLHLADDPFLKEVHCLLIRAGVSSCLSKNKIQINGLKGVTEFINKVGFSNHKHVKKTKALVGI